ncbi:LANO_0G15852g1_1 [Lachancea nothofagi CBS 11611]|uniref:Nucleolar protein SWM2 n=1 Tax=Lachancea nothofagi CBS 11611 TaxID=1266666 RepID=A0A1G4KKP7_9SACH|nr:LANO_0G15852g1_1 [Lachancea nothofagi CBS 11611]
MDEIPRDHLLRFLETFTDINVIPIKLKLALPGYYKAISKDPELTDMAQKKCDSILQNLSDYSSEIVARCSQLRETIQAPQYPTNLIVEDINLQNVNDMPIISKDQHMANLIIEEIDLVDYVAESENTK